MDTPTPTTDGPPTDTADDGSAPARRRRSTPSAQHAWHPSTLPPDGRPRRRTRPTTARLDRENRHWSYQPPRTTGQFPSDASRRDARPARPDTTQTT